MKKFYENPFMAVERFDAENIVTASGEKVEGFNGDTTKLEADYSVRTIDVSTVIDFTF